LEYFFRAHVRRKPDVLEDFPLAFNLSFGRSPRGEVTSPIHFDTLRYKRMEEEE
jgi:hypothetical protein